jgi:hypothetical protein
MVDQLLLVKDQIYTLPVAVMEIYNKLEYSRQENAAMI